MSDDTPTPKAGWLERISAFLLREPEDREQLIELLRSAYERQLLDSDALSMIEGVLQVSEMQARDIVIQTNHSRFPVFEGDRDHVIGILLAKDLLRFYAGEEEFSVRDMLRPAVFIPEAKRLNVLLKDFRANRNHMAMVVDEYGGVAGLVTIEDVLEQIVGDIEDEYDFDETADDIIADQAGAWRVKATTELTHFDTTFGTHYAAEGPDTVGGLVLSRLGRLPKRGEQLALDDLSVKVLRADSRRLHLLLVEKKTSAQ